MLKLPHELELIHFLLAYAGMLIHSLTKLAEHQKLKSFTYSDFLKNNLITNITSAISIPVILIVATDTSLKELLPINYVTALLAGWQTQSIFKSLGNIPKLKLNSNNEEQ